MTLADRDPARARCANVIKVLVVDDSSVFREGLTALLATVPDITVVGETDCGEVGIQRAVEVQPGVVLMDLGMPGAGGVWAARALVAASPHMPVLVLTMDEHDESVFAAMQAGARGYLLKGARQNELLNAIRAVSSGGAVFGPSIARRLIDFFSAVQRGISDAQFSDLTPRECGSLIGPQRSSRRATRASAAADPPSQDARAPVPRRTGPTPLATWAAGRAS